MLEDDPQQDDQSMSPSLRKLKDHLDQMSVKHHLSRLETGISELRHQVVTQNACIGDLSEGMAAGFEQLETRAKRQERGLDKQADDMAVSFRQVVDYHLRLEDQIDTRFNQVNARLDQVESAIISLKEDLKNDMDAMEGRILDTLKQVFMASKV